MNRAAVHSHVHRTGRMRGLVRLPAGARRKIAVRRDGGKRYRQTVAQGGGPTGEERRAIAQGVAVPRASRHHRRDRPNGPLQRRRGHRRDGCDRRRSVGWAGRCWSSRIALRRQLRALHQYRTYVLIRKACLIASESPGASMPCEATDAATARILGQNAKTPPLGERARGAVGRRMVGCDRLRGKG